MWLFNFFLVERTLKQELQKWPKGPMEIWPSCPPPPPGCPKYPLHPSSSPPSPPHHHHPPTSLPNPPPSPPPSECLEGLQALPPLLQGPVGQALGCLHTGQAPPPPGSKIMTGLKLFTSYKLVTDVTIHWFSDVCHPDKTWRTNIKTEKRTKEPKRELKRTKKNI